MAQNVTVAGASYEDVPSVTLTKTGGGTASFTDVTDTTATDSDVLSGVYFYSAGGVRTAGAAVIPSPSDSTPQALGTAASGSSTDYSRADHVHAKPSASDIGAIAAPSSASVDNVLAYNGSAWVADKRTVILSYGHSTWQQFLDAYNANAVIYCRASSNSNPSTGSQTRMAFMAYVNNADTPTNVEFQYYRSVNQHSATQQGDQMYVYKLDKTAGWTVTVRESYTKIVAGTGLSSSYSSGTLTLSNSQTALPTVSSSDKDKYLHTNSSTGALEWSSVASGGGTTVVANPTLAGTEDSLTGLQVGDTKYSVPNIMWLTQSGPKLTLNKTWQEIYDALVEGALIYVKETYDYYVGLLQITNAMNDTSSNQLSVSSAYYSWYADTVDDYPSQND